ncbi:MAG: MotA/TolQ/ExbB proton channel family protein, partial [Phycisphaerales bacterium]
TDALRSSLRQAACACLALVAVPAAVASPQEQAPPDAASPSTPPPAAAPAGTAFGSAAGSVEEKLEASLAELDALRKQMADEMLPLSRRLSALESDLGEVRKRFQDKVRELDSRSLDLANLRNEIEAREKETTYLAGLLGEYQRNFESRLHITELQRYRAALEEAKLAAENTALSEQEISEAQAKLVLASLERLHENAGGTRFAGSAVGEGGLVESGTIVLAGPVAIFEPESGSGTATAEQRLGSLEPAAIRYADPLDADAAALLAKTGAGELPLDPTLGNAHKIAATEETLLEHIAKGGPVMVPILGLAGAAFLVAILKWIGLSTVRMPSRRRIGELLAAIREKDDAKAKALAAKLGGPAGTMLRAGVDNLAEPRDIVEEVMYETILVTRLRLNRFIPFVAIAAAAAPLLGLLGTVTGIINTFKLITVFGSGDVKTLSGGISEALITTEFGLIVAIPSLLLSAFLSRKARGLLDRMEGIALSFLNEVARSRDAAGEPDPEVEKARVAAQVREVLAEMLTPAVREQLAASGGKA